LVLYIHNNPVHHGFVEHACDYPWSSYLSCVSLKPTKLKREESVGWFDSQANFIELHNNQKVDVLKIDDWLGI